MVNLQGKKVLMSLLVPAVVAHDSLMEAAGTNAGLRVRPLV